MNALSYVLTMATDWRIPSEGTGIPTTKADQSAVTNALGAVFIVVGAVCVLFILIGAIRYVTSGGDANGVSRAKDTILYAVIGLVVTLAAFLIVQLVLGLF